MVVTLYSNMGLNGFIWILSEGFVLKLRVRYIPRPLELTLHILGFQVSGVTSAIKNIPLSSKRINQALSSYFI